MILVTGGSSQGKREFVRQYLGEQDASDKDVARAKLALWYNEIEEFGYDTFTTVANSIEIGRAHV